MCRPKNERQREDIDMTFDYFTFFLKKKKLLTLFPKKQSVSMLTLFLGLMRVETASSEEQIV
jgi:hypothetical protein